MRQLPSGSIPFPEFQNLSRTTLQHLGTQVPQKHVVRNKNRFDHARSSLHSSSTRINDRASSLCSAMQRSSQRRSAAGRQTLPLAQMSTWFVSCVVCVHANAGAVQQAPAALAAAVLQQCRWHDANRSTRSCCTTPSAPIYPIRGYAYTKVQHATL